MEYYKLTDSKDCTKDTQWGENVTNKARGEGKNLCSHDVIHVYDHPLKAVMFNPIHTNFDEYHLWEVKVKKVGANDTLKVGVKQCTTIRKIDAPIITTEQRVRFAILCALKVYKEKSFVDWANGWLSEKDKSASAAESAESAAWSAAWSAASAAKSAAWSAAWSAESAAWSAAWSAASAAWRAESAAWSAAESAAWSAASAAESAAKSAAESAARAAKSAAGSAAWSAAKPLDFVALIKRACLDRGRG